MEKYFVMSRCKDEPSFAEYNKSQLLEFLKECGEDEYNYLNSACDPEYLPSMSMLIIKGKIVKPKAAQVAIKYEVE